MASDLAVRIGQRHSVRAVVAAGAVALIVVLGASGSTRQSSAVFSVDARQAREVATVVAFLGAWNGRKLDDALAFLTADVVGSDCDYRLHRAVLFDGKTEFARWLRKRFADRDRLFVSRIWNENREQSLVVGVDYAKRQSSTLAALGASSGIVPKTATKVVFTTGMKIRAFGNGPGGASGRAGADLQPLAPKPKALPPAPAVRLELLELYDVRRARRHG